MLRLLLITGAARSGTSLVAGMFDALGAYGGLTVGPSLENPAGFFENRAIREEIEKPELIRRGVDPLCQRDLPPIGMEIPGLRNDVLRTFRRQGWDGGSPIYYKSAKICHYWPTWTHAFPEATWVIVRRTRSEVIASCERCSFMHLASDWGAWYDEHLPRFGELRSIGAIEIQLGNLRRGDLSEVRAAAESVGLHWCAARAQSIYKAEFLHENYPIPS